MRDAVSPTDLGRITAEEIASQPDCWTQAHAQAVTRPTGLPETGERVLVMGCGTSYYVAAAYAWLREEGKQGVTDAVIASEMPSQLRDYDRVVAISRSGTTTDVAQALAMLPAGLPVTAILGELDTPIADGRDGHHRPVVRRRAQRRADPLPHEPAHPAAHPPR